VLLYRSTGLGFTVPPLFEIDHLRLRPSLFDLFIEEDGLPGKPWAKSVRSVVSAPILLRKNLPFFASRRMPFLRPLIFGKFGKRSQDQNRAMSRLRIFPISEFALADFSDWRICHLPISAICRFRNFRIFRLFKNRDHENFSFALFDSPKMMALPFCAYVPVTP
jgi:hypothetical protein